ncbi:MAG: dockerin type I repeat-containing protein, partial [Hominisplanchenecus sp.]
ASQEAVNNAAYAVLDELFKMAKTADISSLESLIEAAKGLLDGKYTSDSLENLKDAIDAAEAVVADQNRGDSDISDAYANLIDAIIGLKLKGNKAALEAMLKKANEVLENKDAYVTETIEGLAEVTEEAQAVYDNEDALQSEVNEAVKTLTLKVAEARLLGDVDADGEITTADGAAVLRSAAELDTLSAEAAASADVNGDGAVDTGDAVQILQFAAEKITAF